MIRFGKLVASLMSCVIFGILFNTPASAQLRTVDARENCNASATARHYRDNEFTAQEAEPVAAGSIGVGCDLLELRALPFGSSLVLGIYGDIMQVGRIDRISVASGAMLAKDIPTMVLVGGTWELKMPSLRVGVFTPSILMHYGIEVGSIALPRGGYTDAKGFYKPIAMRYTQEMGIAGCVDYKMSFKLCGEYARLTYDGYPQIWFDPNGVRQGRPDAITVGNQISGRIIVPFSILRH